MPLRLSHDVTLTGCDVDQPHNLTIHIAHLAARMVFGVRWSEHITPVLEDLHWLPASQWVVFKTSLMVWKCVHGVAPVYFNDLCVPTNAISGRQDLLSAETSTAGSMHLDCNWIMTFHSQWTRHMEPSATSTMVTGCVGECLQARLWRGTCSRPPDAIETSSWFWRWI